MPPWLIEVFKVLGFATPFVYAAAVFGAFHYADKKASREARGAISTWLQSRNQGSNTEVGDAVIELFNRFYTPNLRSPAAFTRSALFTVCMSAIFLYELDELSWDYATFSSHPVVIAILANIFSDFVGLFVVKELLIRGRGRPVHALLGGALAGMAIVGAFTLGQNLIVNVLNAMEYPLDGFWSEYLELLESTFTETLWLALFLAALVVHLWLPLLFFSALALRTLNYLKIAVGWIQWFLRAGQQHPLEAIGYVAALLVFIVTAVFQIIVARA